MFNFFNEVKENLKDKNKLEFDVFNLVNISGRILYAEGHKGLVTLSKELISFKVKTGVILVEGKDLLLSELSENTLKIGGHIKKVEEV